MSHFELRDSLTGEGASSGFSGRVADVFAGLGTGLVKSDKSNDEKMKNIKPDFDRQQLERMKTNSREARRPQEKEDDSEAAFKRPKFDSRNERGQRGGHRGRGGHRVADHVKNPEKYTKYSLKDVPEISNKSNSAAAFDFLQKLRKENNEEDEEPAADLSQKIVFKKRGKKESKSNAEQNEPNVTNVEKPESSGNGFQKESNTSSRSKNKNKSKLLTLSHLDDEEEEN